MAARLASTLAAQLPRRSRTLAREGACARRHPLGQLWRDYQSAMIPLHVATQRSSSSITAEPPLSESLAAARTALPWQRIEWAYCINLDRRPERWRYMQDQFTRLEMPVQRWKAVDGQTVDVPHLAEIGIIAKEAMPRYYLPDEQKLFGTDLTNGGIGCALSHMQIWRDVIRRSARGASRPFLVIEDDCTFLDDFSEETIFARLAEVPQDWEIVFLGGQDLMRQQHNYQVAPGVRRLYKGFRETTAYLINDAGAKAALEVCIPMYWQVDTHLNDESLREGLRPRRGDEQDVTMKPRGYCLWPPICSQDRHWPTDVQKVEHDA